MSTPWVPPYFGSYEQLVNELLHDPFLGSGRPRPHAATELSRTGTPATETTALHPQPQPWRSGAVSYLVTAVSMKEIAAQTRGNLQEQLTQNADAAIDQFLDDFCGTPPSKIPWHWPGPPPWNSVLAAELAMVANTLQSGFMRTELLSLAGRIIEKGFGQTAVAAAGR